MTALIDGLGRRMDYLRLSVIDRCNLRCHYCMGADPDFLPKDEVLSLEELARLSRLFIRLGVRKIRLTGGEPLVRRDILTLVRELGSEAAAGRLAEVTLTTNGTRLTRHAADLAAAGMRRINVSVDSLDPATFRSKPSRSAKAPASSQLPKWEATNRPGLPSSRNRWTFSSPTTSTRLCINFLTCGNSPTTRPRLSHTSTTMASISAALFSGKARRRLRRAIADTLSRGPMVRVSQPPRPEAASTGNARSTASRARAAAASNL